MPGERAPDGAVPASPDEGKTEVGKAEFWPPFIEVCESFVEAKERGEFRPGDVLPHEWFARILGVRKERRLDAAGRELGMSWPWQYYAQMRRVGSDLNVRCGVLLWRNDPVGYRWIPEEEAAGHLHTRTQASVEARVTRAAELARGVLLHTKSREVQRELTDQLQRNAEMLMVVKRHREKRLMDDRIRRLLEAPEGG